MLAQNFMSAEALEISEEHRDALIVTLRAFESGRITAKDFDLDEWVFTNSCGTVRCIGGWVEFLNPGVLFASAWANGMLPSELDDLFSPIAYRMGGHFDGDCTVAEATMALRNYLTIGSPDWAGVRESSR